MELKHYKAIRRGILSSLQIWRKLTDEEKKQFNDCKNEIQVDNMMTMFRRKYL